jgi:fructose-bisphosphate aldolase class I
MQQHTPSLTDIATTLMTPKKGIFAVDESPRTMQKRLALAGIQNGTEEDSDALREMLFSMQGLGEYISGAILYESSFTRTASNGNILAELLREQGIMLGVKVDKGLAPLLPHVHTQSGEVTEQVCRGLDTLAERLPTFYEKGARFTKWRSVFSVSDTHPTETCITANAHVLAQYAVIVQEAGMVPIVEPEVLYSGEHSLERSQEVITTVLQKIFAVLAEYSVDMSEVILKSSMALPGKESGVTHSAKEIAESTLTAFEASVPKEVPGIVFLSGGQTPDMATENLRAIYAGHNGPWGMTFSYSRAIEEEAIVAWQGKQEHVASAHQVLRARLEKLVSAIS